VTQQLLEKEDSEANTVVNRALKDLRQQFSFSSMSGLGDLEFDDRFLD
jgi:hypothetical protein